MARRHQLGFALLGRIVIGSALLLVPAAGLNAQTAFKTGEQTTGLTKQCFYAFAGSEYTKTVKSIELCPLSISVSGSGTPTPTKTISTLPKTTSTPRPTTFSAMKTGEETTGLTKQCFYEFAGSRYTKTIKSVQLCPLSISVPAK